MGSLLDNIVKVSIGEAEMACSKCTSFVNRQYTCRFCEWSIEILGRAAMLVKDELVRHQHKLVPVRMKGRSLPTRLVCPQHHKI